MNEWSCNGTTFAKLNLKTLRGEPGLGFYRLIAQVEVTTHGKPAGEEVSVINIRGEMQVRGKDQRDRYLGNLRRLGTDSSIMTYQHIGDNNFQLEIEMDARRVEAIEEIRLGEDLLFTLTLYGLAYSEREKRSQPVNVTLQYRANQSAWIEILQQMGYRRTMLLEIPLLGDEVSPRFPEAAEHLKTAQTRLLCGHFRDAVGACRDVMESLSVVLSDENTQPPEIIKSWFENTRSMGKEERLRIVRRALKLLTHPARHADEVSASIEWRPMDARTVISLTAALLQITTKKD